ncbi:hypothetical protein [Arthrobacter sp. PsM3]|uniref:hypothetical protein n=1 Tax=Arthrobacter sp. PsM3 TaxID=3030531 RepID=UPI00263BB5E8|nr:hypothetical protein [Arthrobacter sp. PsM3]MDN4644916.1 hypothetical protein [Arthrobacter sp. PsM3]
MALTSVFYDGVVTETDRAKNRTGAPDYGVYGVGDFEVTAHPSIPYAVLSKAGRAHGHGVTDTAGTDQVVQCGTLASGTRWDLIVVRRNWQNSLGGPSTLVAIPGGTTMEIPAARKIGPGVEDDQPIALVQWQGGLSAPAKIVDLRVWAGNGALFAKDDLVKTYMTKPGTEININGTVWAYQIGASSTLGWSQVSYYGAIPLFGAGPALSGDAASAAAFFVQGGTSVLKTDTSGFVQLPFPKPFPNGLLTFVPSNGDMNLDRAIQAALTFGVAGGSPWGTGNKTGVVVSVERYNGAPQVEATVRCNWIAIGW